MIRVALFASGQGTNALNLLKAAQRLPNIAIPLVIVDQKSSPLPKKISEIYSNVEVAVVPRPPHAEPEEARRIHEVIMLEILKKHSIDWCFLAGYMRILGPTLLEAFRTGEHNRIVNIHPSLLPAYPGLHAYEKSFAAHEALGGATVHLVDNGMDTGSIIQQRSFERHTSDTLEIFIERGKALEWKLYAEVMMLLNDQGTLIPRARKS